jgi:hypothetical protein
LKLTSAIAPVTNVTTDFMIFISVLGWLMVEIFGAAERCAKRRDRLVAASELRQAAEERLTDPVPRARKKIR